MEAFNIPITIPISYAFPSTISSVANSMNPNPNPNPRIWSRLPQRLVDRVIAFLPPAAFFRFRSVCKRWYSLLFSTAFLEMYLEISPRRHFFIFFHQKPHKTYNYNNTSTIHNHGPNYNEGYLFDPETLNWNRIPFPLIPPGFSPASSSGGIICFVSDEAGSKSILLCNPLFSSSLITQLPATARPRLCPSIGLTVTNSSVDLVVAGDDLISPYAVKNLTTERFYVDGGGFYSIWGTNSALPRLCSFESGRMVFCNGRFYCMNYSPFSVLGYDVSANHWFKIQAPMRRFLRSPSLVESRGKIVLVAAVEKSKLNVPRSLRLWCLQDCGTAWAEIERMPQQLYAEFAEVEGGRGFSCVGHGEFVVVVIRGSEKALLFDFWRKRWVWMPPCPYVQHGGGELDGYAYEPRLATPVTGLLDQLTLPFQSFNG